MLRSTGSGSRCDSVLSVVLVYAVQDVSEHCSVSLRPPQIISGLSSYNILLKLFGKANQAKILVVNSCI